MSLLRNYLQRHELTSDTGKSAFLPWFKEEKWSWRGSVLDWGLKWSFVVQFELKNTAFKIYIETLVIALLFELQDSIGDLMTEVLLKSFCPAFRRHVWICQWSQLFWRDPGMVWICPCLLHCWKCCICFVYAFHFGFKSKTTPPVSVCVL